MWKFILIVLLFLSEGAIAAQEISVGTLYDYMNHDKNIAIKRIDNFGDETAFVKVSIHEIVYDDKGSPIEKELTSDGTREIVASPSRMIIPKNGMQVVRYIYLGSRDKERYFRVRFIPVSPEEFKSEQDLDVSKNEIRTGVNILTGFGTILFIRPDKLNFDTNIYRKGDNLYVENNGNSTIVLDNFERCYDKDKSDSRTCTPAEVMHILPGVKRVVSLQGKTLVSFSLIEDSETNLYSM